MEKKIPVTSNLTVFVPWVLERLLKGEYHFSVDEKGQPRRVELDPKFGDLDVPTMEDDLRAVFEAEGKAELFFTLKNQHSSKDISRVMRKIFSPPLAQALSRQLADENWENIVACVYWEIKWFGERVAKLRIKGREESTSIAFANFDFAMEESRPGSFQIWAAEKCTRDLMLLFPKMVSRLTSLRILPVTTKLPSYLIRYLRESARCYFFGQCLASLVLCRSAIETAVEERLRELGYGTEVDKIKEHKIRNMVEMTREKGLLDDKLCRRGQRIRKKANDAVHGKFIPEDKECAKLFYETREIVEHLYK